MQRSLREGSGIMAKYTVDAILQGPRVEAENTDAEGRADCAISYRVGGHGY